MEIDPLKIPAFMRQKSGYRKQVNLTSPVSIKSSAVASPVTRLTTPRPVIKIQSPHFESPFLAMLEADMAKRSGVKLKPEPILTPVGEVTHYYNKIQVAVVRLHADLEVGTRLQFVGEKSSFKQKLDSMQIDREPVQSAGRGDEVGVKVKKPVLIGETVFLIH